MLAIATIYKKSLAGSPFDKRAAVYLLSVENRFITNSKLRHLFHLLGHETFRWTKVRSLPFDKSLPFTLYTWTFLLYEVISPSHARVDRGSWPVVPLPRLSASLTLFTRVSSVSLSRD